MSKHSIKGFLLTIIALVITITSVLPYYVMVVMGTHITEDLFKGLVILPGKYLLGNLLSVVKSGFFQSYINSLYVATITTLVSVFVSALCGYAFAKYDFKAKKALYNIVLITMMIPSQLGLIAFIVEMKLMGLTNSHMPLIIIGLTSAFGVFWMTQYIKGSVPSEVIESARIDGYNEFSIFLRIVIPYIRPAIITLSMFAFLGSWNNYLIPLITISKQKLYTVPLAISTLGNLYRTDYAAKIMGLTLGTIPLIILFSIGSRNFIQGLTAGAIKG